MKVCTLMMVCFNRLPLTIKTMNGLLKSNKLPCNLVIIDNGSVDGTVEYLKQLQESEFNNSNYKVKLILLPENKGIAVGRNLALKEADELKTDYYCTIDNDVELPDGWLEECINILDANKGYGSIGVNFEGVSYPLVTKNGYTFQEKPAGNLGTALTVFRKQLHQAIGFFTTEYGIRYGLEDSNFFMRARFYGFKLGYISRNGIHLGVGECDSGDYRKWKTIEHDSMVGEFKNDCRLYAQKKKPLYIPFKE